MKRIFILVICLLLCSCSKPVFKNVTIKEDKIKSDKISLTMVGDALIHAPIYKDAYDRGSYNFIKDFKYVLDDFKNRDLLYYNAETIYGGKMLGYSGYPNFNTPEEFGDTMIAMGFNLVSRATNHTLDKGEKGILNACRFWDKYKFVLTSGSDCKKSQPKIFVKNHIRYALLSYTTLTNGYKSPNDYYVNIYDEKRVLEDVNYLKNKCDVIIVAMHFGDEYKNLPNDNQKNIAKYLASLGVNIIIGTHPHVIEPIEYIGDTLVIYSLGNFISSQSTVDDYERLIGLLVNIDIIKTNINNEIGIKLDNLNTKLIYTYYKNYHGYRVIPFDKLNDNILPNYRYYHKKYNDIIKYYDKNILTH